MTVSSGTRTPIVDPVPCAQQIARRKAAPRRQTHASRPEFARVPTIAEEHR